MPNAIMHRPLAASLAAASLVVLFAAHAEARSWSVTGRGGRTYSHTVTHYNSGNGNVGRSASTNTPNGTATRQFTQTNNGNGTYTDTQTITARDGESYTRSLTRN